MALRKVSNVEIRTKSWPVYEHRYRFGPGSSKRAPRTSPWLSEKQYQEAQMLQSSTPVCVGTFLNGSRAWRNMAVRGRSMWWYKDSFYVRDQEDSLGRSTRDTVEGLTRVGSVTVRCEELSPAMEPKKGLPWRSRITGMREGSAEDSLTHRERQYFFAIGTSKKAPPRTAPISEARYLSARKVQTSLPILVGAIVSGRTTWRNTRVRDKQLWWYKDEFYLGQDDVLSQATGADIAAWTEIPGVQVESTESSVRHYEDGYSFAIGKGRSAPVTWPPVPKKEYARASSPKSPEPVCLGTVPHGAHAGKSLWCYKDDFYVENDGFTPEQVQLLLWEKGQRKKRRFERLRKEMLSSQALEQARRERIPEEVRIFVWKRDNGRCVQCGSQQSLEFDHIIPVSKGGSNTARNIQLLCERCNRTKSDNI